MVYVPAFFETFLVLVLALAVLTWVQRRSPLAGRVMPVLVVGVLLPTVWGGAAVYAEDVRTVALARYTAMGFAFFGLVVALGWAVAARSQPVVQHDEPPSS